MDHRAPTPLGRRQHEEDVIGGQDMQGYVVTSHRVRDRSQHPGFWPVRKAPHLGHPEVGLPRLGSHLSRELALHKPGANNPGPCPPTVPSPAKDSVHTPPLPPPKMEEVGLGTSY